MRSKRWFLNEEGQSLVIVGFALTALLLFAMFAVDLSYAYVQRRQMQNAADAAALAGAYKLTVHQGMGEDGTLTNGQLYAEILDWAQRNEADTVQALYIRPDGTTFAINQGDGSLAPSDPGVAAGVYVKASTTFPTFFARFIGLGMMDISAEAEASFGAAWAVRGAAPLAVRYSDFNVGDEYQLFSGNYKHTQARWGWLGLDCTFPSKCSPDANSLKDWMRNGYQGGTSRGHDYMADPGLKASVLGQAEVGQVLLLPLFDKIYQFTTDERCNPDSTRYDPDWCETACKGDYDNVVCEYTSNQTLNHEYYYHIIAFAAFKVSGVGQGGHYLDGEFVSYVVDGTWTNPSPWDKGVVVMRLTERDKPPTGDATSTSPPPATDTPVPTDTAVPTATPTSVAPTDTPEPSATPTGPLPTDTPAPTATATATPCLTPNAPTVLAGSRSGKNVYLSWNAPSGPPVTLYYIYWATSQNGTYGFLTSTTSTAYSYKTDDGRWYYVTAVNDCGEGPASNKAYVPPK